MFHAMQRRIEGPFFRTKRVVGECLDVPGDAVAVLRTTTERREHQQIERPLEGIVFAASQHLPRTLG